MNLNRRKFLKKTALLGAITIVPRYVLGNGYVPPSDKINIGVIGIGKQSRGLTSNFLKRTDAQIVAGCDVWTTKMKWFQEFVSSVYADHRDKPDFKGIDVYRDYELLLERSDIDAVIIATPDHWHALHSIAAMKSGKDVFCEKPLTHKIEEGQQMVAAAKKTGRLVQTGSMQRSWENFRKACELVRNGYLGEISKVLVNVGGPASSSVSGSGL